MPVMKNMMKVLGEHRIENLQFTWLFFADPISKDIIKLLLENGAKVNAVYADYNWKGSGSNRTAFQMVLDKSLESNDSEILALFFKIWW